MRCALCSCKRVSSGALVASAILVLAVLARGAQALPAFPGAEGPGSTASGGRNYSVYHVTNLNDTGPGSFREAINGAGASNRIVVFDVGGTIWMSGGWVNTGVSNITIAGQTAPGGGIVIYGLGTKFTGTNVVVRNVHFRPGDAQAGGRDGLWLETKNSIIDHCSVEWSTDEGISSTDAVENTTVQYCFISEGLNYAGHSYGCIAHSEVDGAVISYHHNLFANNKSRNPRLGNSSNAQHVVDFRNNVLYDWISNCGYSTNAEEGDGSFIGNYYIAGPSTQSDDRAEAFTAAGARTHIYQSGNKIDSNLNGVFDGTDTGWGMFTGLYTKVSTEFAIPNIYYTQTADAALQTVLNYAGAFWWNRDTVDARIVNQVRTGTGAVINHTSDVGGFTYFPEVHRPADWDTDNDGMPNYWELAYGLDPNVDDHNGDFDADGYTNLEEYINQLEWFPPPKPIVWLGGSSGTAGRYELITNWDIPWQPTLADQAEINSGKATVGYIGQEAGTLYVANTPGGSAELAVTAGKLTVGNNLVLGGTTNSNGTLTVSGGTLVVGNTLRVSNASSAMGIVTLSGGSISGYRTYVGAIGMGTFVQTAGTHQLSNSLLVGGETNSKGTGNYTLSEGLLKLGDSLKIGIEGVGTFIHSGGSVDITNNLWMHRGSYWLGGSGKVNVNNTVSLGYGSVMEILGGSLTVSGPMLMASGASSAAELKVAKAAYVEVGGLTINSGGGRSTKVTMELDANGPSLIRTTGVASLAGTLEVDRDSNTYRPNQGNTFTLILATSGTSNFSTISSNIPGLLLIDPNDPGLGYWPAFRGAFDANADYVVTFQGAMPGDIGGDNKVSITDLGDLAAHWGNTSASWSQGDFDGDGQVNVADLGDLAAHWGQTGLAPSAAPPEVFVPEPTVLALLALGGLALIRRRS